MTAASRRLSAVEKDGKELAEIRQQRDDQHMHGDRPPRHHGLRARHRMMAGQCLGVLHADEQRHTDADQKHEQERHERRRARLGRRIHMAVTHRHAQHEGGQEHLDMNAARPA